ncbi:MAG: prolyl oligopeptidase family serine peptidase [Acidobacteria bacterium]|jgi:prolyl oligopeptidase|nr:prolyl oligopeptidase family serine peptidase [Acidobacteriota bacterium]
MNHFKVMVIIISLVGFLTTLIGADKLPLTYPATNKCNQVDDYYGEKVSDPYRWLEDVNSQETAGWVTQQKKFTDEYLSKIEFRETIKTRLTEISNYEKYSRPNKQGKYYVFWKNTGLQDQYVVYIQEGLTGKPKILLDPNAFSADGSITLTDIYFSNDHKYVGCAISQGGSDWREFFVVETETGKKLPDRVCWAKFTDMTWYKDGFFYSRYDEPKEADKLKAKIEFQKVFYHKIGTPQAEDKPVYRDDINPQLGFNSNVTENEKYLVITAWEGSANHNFLYYKNLAADGPVVPLVDKPLGQFGFVEEMDNRFLFMTDCDAPNFKLILLDPLHPQKENWKVIVPEGKDKMDNASYVGNKLIVSYLKDANTLVSVYEPDGKKLYDVTLPGIGTARGFAGKKEDKEVFYTFSSYTVPTTIFRYDIKENKSELFRESILKFDPKKFETIQVFYESKDKTRIPLFIVYKKGLKLDGQNPCLIYGYGGFNSPMQPSFNASNIPLLEAGGVYAVACLRGGSEYGEDWHRAALFEKKQNVFDDFIAGAEYLISKGYTSPGKLAAYGASNGGLLVAAVINQRPDLYRVAFPAVGVLDMLRYHKFTIGWAWAGEYGSSEKPEQFKYLYAYSPLHNIKGDIAYPATLVETADHDDRVFPAHSFKYIATMQEKYKGSNPVLLKVETKVGHGTGSTTTKTIERYTDMYSFMFYNMGIKPVFK